MRFGLLAMSSTQDVRYSAREGRAGPAAANKLWNASRLVLQRVDADARAARRGRATSRTAGSSRACRRARATFEAAIDALRLLARARSALYDFVYGELCDWYLEMVKPRLYEADGEDAPTSPRRCCTCCARRSRSRTR